MGDLGNNSELEAELIKRNREIAKVRDEVLKTEKRLEEAQMRNDDLLEKVSELDSEVTKGKTLIEELESKVKALEEGHVTKDQEHEKLKDGHLEELENMRKDFEEKAIAQAADTAAQDAFKRQIEELEAAKERLQKELDEERLTHGTTKSTLSQSENAHREMANSATEHRRKAKELEDELVEKTTALKDAHSISMEEERSRLGAELQRATMTLEEHKAVRDDLETQVGEHDDKLSGLETELTDTKRELEDHRQAREDLERSRDEISRQHEELKESHEGGLASERQRVQEHLTKATQQAAQLDGKLQGQRELYKEANQALMRSEKREEQLTSELSDRVSQLTAEHESAQDALRLHEDKASSHLSEREAAHLEALESELGTHRRKSVADLEAASRKHEDTEEEVKRHEARIATLLLEHQDVQANHNTQLETLRAQAMDLRSRLGEAEEKGLGHEQGGEKTKKDLEDARLEKERMEMAHKQELERLQQTLEAEGVSRNSAEKIAGSQLEEKETLLAHRDAAIERLEFDLESSKKRIGELEAEVTKTQEEGEDRSKSLGVRRAELEGQLRSKQEKLTEVEGRLDAQRQYMEQMAETLSKAHSDRDGLMEMKGSLEATLKLEMTHKEAVSSSLQQAQEESTRRNKELEERILQLREKHKDELEDHRRSVADELTQNQERLEAVEAELVTARQRCEVLQRNKAVLEEEMGGHREKHVAFESSIKEHVGEKDRLQLDLDQHMSSKASLEQDVARLQDERRECDIKINDLMAEVRSKEEEKDNQANDFGNRIRQLDDLMKSEQSLRESAERSLTSNRRDSEDQNLQLDAERRRVEQDLRAMGDSHRDRGEDLDRQLRQSKEQVETQRARAEELDQQRRETESTLRGEIATVEARLRRFESEAQIKARENEEMKADIAQQRADSNAKILALQRQIEAETKIANDASKAKDAAKNEMETHTEGRSQLMERAAMASEELSTRQVEYALERQRLNGALEESRRTLRNSLGVPNPVAAVDSVRLSSLEQQLSEERRKNIESVVALQRAERKGNQLDEKVKKTEERSAESAQTARDAERRASTLAEDLRKKEQKQASLEQKTEETRERAAMASAEISTVKYEAKYEAAKLRGALDELRYMLKMQS